MITITIATKPSDIVRGPSWETLEAMIRSTRDDDGKFTRIARDGRGPNYRDTCGEYDCDWTPSQGDIVPVRIVVSNEY